MLMFLLDFVTTSCSSDTPHEASPSTAALCALEINSGCMTNVDNDRLGHKSGRRLPQSKSCRMFQPLSKFAQRLGLRQPSAAFYNREKIPHRARITKNYNAILAKV